MSTSRVTHPSSQTNRENGEPSKSERRQQKDRAVFAILSSIHRMHFTDEDSIRLLKNLQSKLVSQNLTPKSGFSVGKLRRIIEKSVLRLNLPLDTLLSLSHNIKDPILKEFFITQVHRKDSKGAIKDKYKGFCSTLLDRVREAQFICPNYLQRTYRVPKPLTKEEAQQLERIFWVADKKLKDFRADAKAKSLPQSDVADPVKYSLIENSSYSMKRGSYAQCFEIASFIHFEAISTLPFDESSAFVSVVGGDHSCNVIGILPNCDPTNPRTYGPSAYFVDGWDDASFSAVDAETRLRTSSPQRKYPKLPDGSCNYSQVMTYPYDPKKHVLRFRLTTIYLPQEFTKSIGIPKKAYKIPLKNIELKLCQFHAAATLPEKLSIAHSILDNELSSESPLWKSDHHALVTLMHQLVHFTTLWEPSDDDFTPIIKR